MAIRLDFPMNEIPPIVVADISVYQANYSKYPDIVHFDWDKYYAMGGRAVKLRFSVGCAGEDFELDYNLSECLRLGIYIWGYHYAKLWHNLDKQAAIFAVAIEKAEATGLLLGVYHDIEANDGLDKNTFTANAQKLFNKTAALSDFVILDDNPAKSNIGPYTRGLFWDYNTYRTDYFKHLPLWIAHHYSETYEVEPYTIPSWRPLIPDDWAAINNPVGPHWWQFEDYDGGEEWGSNGDDEIDLNWFTWKGGTYQAFEDRYGVSLLPHEPPPIPDPEPEPEPIPETDRLQMEVVQEGLRVRTGPGTGYAIIGELPFGQVVDVLDIGGDSAWVRIGEKQWSNVEYYGDKNMKVVKK